MKSIAYRRINNLPLIVIGILVSIFIISFTLINILKFRAFSPTCFGWAYIHIYPKLASLQNPFTIFKLPEFNILILLAPLNYILAFIYFFIQRPEILFVLQGIIMTSGAIPIYLLAKERLKDVYLAMAVSVSYLLHPIITTGLMLGYTPLASGMPLFLYAFYYLEKNNIKIFILFMALAILSKIDAALIAVIFSGILFFSKSKKKYGKIILLFGIPWLIICTLSCLIYLKSIDRLFPVGLLHFDKYGDKVSDALRYALNNPGAIINNIFNKGNMLFYIFYAIPNIFSFLSLFYLLPVIPELIFVLIRNQHSTAHFLILAFVFMGSVYGLERFINFIQPLFRQYLSILPKKLSLPRIFAAVIIVSASMRHYYIKPKSDFSDKLGPMPFTKGFNWKFYNLNQHLLLGNKLLALIPANTSCLTQQSLAPHLGKCKYLAPITRQTIAENYNWEYIFLDLSKDDFYEINRNEVFLYLKGLIMQKNYGIMTFKDGWILLKYEYPKDNKIELLTYLNKLLSDEKKN